MTAILYKNTKECLSQITSHSFRVGSAQSLAMRGADTADLMQAGGWISPDMPARYIAAIKAEKNAMARLRYGV